MYFPFSARSCSSDSLDKILRREEIFENIELLSADLLYKLDPGHCYTLITDPLYSEILQIKLFEDIGRSTYFVIQIPFNEDMMSPMNGTLAALREAHRAGCSCYLIYLANGIQMSRFLRFVDRFVVQKLHLSVHYQHVIDIFAANVRSTRKRSLSFCMIIACLDNKSIIFGSDL